MYITTLDQKIAEFFNNLNINGWPIGNFILCGLSLMLTFLFCGLLGAERERRGKGAGLRTHLLVGVGSCVIMIISIYGFPVFTDGTQYATRDIARLAAQVVTGIGFLGAGVIIHRSTGVKGLTTAATVWLAMAIGLACGSMNFILAGATVVFIMVALLTFRKVDGRIKKKQASYLLVCALDKPVMQDLIKLAEDLGSSLQHIDTDLSGDGKYLLINFRLIFDNTAVKNEVFLERVLKIDGVVNAHALNYSALEN